MTKLVEIIKNVRLSARSVEPAVLPILGAGSMPPDLPALGPVVELVDAIELLDGELDADQPVSHTIPVATQTAEEELAKLTTQAYEEAYQRGLEAAKVTTDASKKRLTALLERIPVAFEQALQNLEPDVVSIALAAATRIVGEQALDRAHSLAIVQATLAELKTETVLCLHLSPADYEFLQQQNTVLTEKQLLRVAPSARVELGGCIIDTETGSLDARFESQLQKVKDVLTRALSQADAES